MAETLFEDFNVPAIYWNTSNVSGIYAEGKTTGMVLDSGFSGVYCLNVFGGYPIEDNIASSFKGGNYLNQRLKEQILGIVNHREKGEIKKQDYYGLYGYSF